ncbi:proton-coupled amino acid transporter-like protein CG1139 isoform X2 [Phymastichus coffea]|uniref:proton-coupled amino acid transporter-like protein CG1139 isoform X2 n=1 Tax=Phymastichus coffea TaxID=108790 RepID=UPI00273B0B98|nr:proton-coupled amino acid transporter-like protein CG1139 isoform X2 [Phymastichus coffea]
MSRKNSEDSTPVHASNFKETHIRPMIVEYDSKRHGVKTELSDMVLFKYKCEKNEVPITIANGSTLPLVERPNDEEAALYDPFEHRKLAHPTSDLDTLIHLLKGSLGSGILAMPIAFKSSGLYFGLFATFFIGAVCTYCVHILVKCAHILCKRTQTPSLGFAEVAEAAFLVGPESIQKYARLAKATINTFLVLDLIGCCCVYVVFVSENIKHVADSHITEIYGKDDLWDVRIYMAILLPFLIAFSLVKNLKFLAPFSMVANCLIAAGLGITFYYIFTDLPELKDAKKITSIGEMPLFFGIAIFALEGIGVVMPLENNMKTPTHFIGCPGVLNIGMFFVISLYSTVGFFGYLKYQQTTKGSITLNLPEDDPLAQAVKLMIAAAIFFTYGLQFYVPMEIIWKNVKGYFGSHKLIAEYILRIILVTFTVGMAIAIPNLGPFISLVGALCLSTLGLMFPSVIELVTVWEQERGLGRFKWKLWKNIMIISFGVLGLLTGTYTSLCEITGTVNDINNDSN